MQYKNKKTIEEEFNEKYKNNDFFNPLLQFNKIMNSPVKISEYIHQIRQDDLNAIKEMIEGKELIWSEDEWRQKFVNETIKDILQELDNLNKE